MDQGGRGTGTSGLQWCLSARTYLGSGDYILRDRREVQIEIPGHPSVEWSTDALSYLSTEAGSRRDMRELQAWILAHPDADLSIEALSERAAMSPRNFAAVFRDGDGHDAGQVRGASAH